MDGDSIISFARVGLGGVFFKRVALSCDSHNLMGFTSVAHRYCLFTYSESCTNAEIFAPHFKPDERFQHLSFHIKLPGITAHFGGVDLYNEVILSSLAWRSRRSSLSIRCSAKRLSVLVVSHLATCSAEQHSYIVLEMALRNRRNRKVSGATQL